MGWFDTFKGSGFGGKGLKIATNADGSKVWVEREGEAQVLSATERGLVEDAARRMGATLADPDGVFRASVNFEAQIERSHEDVAYRANQSMGIDSAYNNRTYREMMQHIDDRVREELAKLGVR